MQFALVTRQVTIPIRAHLYTGDHGCGESYTKRELANFAVSCAMCQLAKAVCRVRAVGPNECEETSQDLVAVYRSLCIPKKL